MADEKFSKVGEQQKQGPLRVILGILGLAVLVFAIYELAISFNWFGGDDETTATASAPQIQSIPGIGTPSKEYAKLVQDQNKLEVKQAEKEGKSAVPTIIGAQYSFDTQGFEDQLKRAEELAKESRDPKACSEESLERARQAGVTASELRCNGCTASELKTDGYTAAQLKAAGFTAAELKQAGFSAQELKSAGFTAKELKAAGFTSSELRAAGFNAKQLKAAGFTAKELRDAGFSAKDLKDAGFSAKDLKSAGFSPSELVSAGYTPAEMAQSGYSTSELMKAGLTPSELLKAGVPAKDLVQAGVSARQLLADGAPVGALLDAGVKKSALESAGVTPAQIDAFEKSKSLMPGGVCTKEFAASERKSGVSAKELKLLGCTPATLKDAGYTPAELKDAGFTAAQLKKAGFSSSQLAQAGFSADDLRKAGFTADDLKKAGYTAKQLKDAGYNSSDLKDAGFSAKDLTNAGFSPKDLEDAGYTPAEMKKAGITASELINSGFSPAQLKDAGFTASQLKNAGVSAAELRKSGYSAGDLSTAGYSTSQIKGAGYTNGALLRAGVPIDSTDLGKCSEARLRVDLQNGVSAMALKAKGCAAKDLLNAGYSANQLIKAGYTTSEIAKPDETGLCAVSKIRQEMKAGKGAKFFKDEGCDASALQAAGFSVEAMKNAGYTASDLKNAGVTARELSQAGFNPAQLKSAGYSTKQLKNAGFTASELAKSGVSAAELADAGYTSQEVDSMGEAEKSAMTDKALSPGESEIAKVQREQKEQLMLQQQQNKITELSSGMQSQAATLFASWEPTSSTQQMVVGPAPTDDDAATVAIKGKKSELPEGVDPSGDVVKTGTIMYAVLDNTVDSDEMSPVLATIVSGELADTKLIGSFTQTGTFKDTLTLQFTNANIPGVSRTVPVKLFAIDVDSARNMTVDNHYMVKYGALFAASFLQGFSGAIQQSGRTTVTSNGSLMTTSTEALSDPKLIASGLGAVGTSVVESIKQAGDIMPTVRLKKGSAFAVLFMSDFSIPAKNG